MDKNETKQYEPFVYRSKELQEEWDKASEPVKQSVNKILEQNSKEIQRKIHNDLLRK